MERYGKYVFFFMAQMSWRFFFSKAILVKNSQQNFRGPLEELQIFTETTMRFWQFRRAKLGISMDFCAWVLSVLVLFHIQKIIFKTKTIGVGCLWDCFFGVGGYFPQNGAWPYPSESDKNTSIPNVMLVMVNA